MASRSPDTNGPRREEITHGLFWLLKRGWISVLAAAGQAHGAVTHTELPLLLVVTDGGIWLIFLFRLLLHLGPGSHVSWNPQARARAECPDPARRDEWHRYAVRLNATVAGEAIHLLGWAAVEYANWRHPQAWVQLALCVSLWGTITMLAAYSATYTEMLGVRSGTEVIQQSRAYRRWKRLYSAADQVPGHDEVNAFLDDPAPKGKVSRTVGLSLVGVTLIGFATAPQAVGEIASALKHVQAPASHEPTKTPGRDEAGSAARGPRTYEDLCSGQPEPGAGAPIGMKHYFHDLWKGGHGIDGDGAVQAGCARRVQAERHHPTILIEPSYCGTELRALAVKTDNQPAVLLYQEAARFASALAARGQLYSASARLYIGGGDAYLINSQQGSWLLFRSQQSLGSLKIRKHGLPCKRLDAENAPYLVLPPPVVDWWVTEMASRRSWVQPIWHAHPSRHAIEFEVNGQTVAQFECETTSACTLHIGGDLYEVTSRWTTTSKDVVRYAPDAG